MPRTRRMLAAAVSSPSPAASPVAPAQPSTPAACACASPAPGGAPTPAGYVARRAAGADDSFLSRKLREISNLNAVASKPLDACWAEGKKIPRCGGEAQKKGSKSTRRFVNFLVAGGAGGFMKEAPVQLLRLPRAVKGGHLPSKGLR